MLLVAAVLLLDEALARFEEIAQGDDASQAARGGGGDDGQLFDSGKVSWIPFQVGRCRGFPPA
jgi:hypothetical protein